MNQQKSEILKVLKKSDTKHTDDKNRLQALEEALKRLELLMNQKA